MSSTATNSASATTPTQTEGPQPDRNTTTGANYFFGFLITFIALLMFFVACGVGSRRRMRRRRDLLLGLDEWAASFDGEGRVNVDNPPKIWEPWLRGVGEEKEGRWDWATIVPLAATVTTEKPPTSPSTTQQPSTPTSNPTRPTLRPSRNSYAINGLSLPSWTHLHHDRRHRHRRDSSVAKEKQRESEDDSLPKKLQVAVMIAMPSQDRLSERPKEEDEPPGVYEIGVTHVPWEEHSAS